MFLLIIPSDYCQTNKIKNTKCFIGVLNVS